MSIDGNNIGTPNNSKPTDTKIDIDLLGTNIYGTSLQYPEDLKRYTDDIKTKQLTLTNAQTAFSDNNTQPGQVATAEDQLKSAKVVLEEYKTSLSDKITIEAYLSKNKSSSKMTKTFTATVDGLN